MSEVPDHLRQIIRNKSAIIVVGAGVSISATNNSPVSSWRGLLNNGILHCQIYGKPPLSKDLTDHNLKILLSTDTDAWLSVASLIERKLKYPDNREWAKWIDETIGRLRVVNPDLIEAISSLNLPIITTNYDGLFSDKRLSRKFHAINWNTRFFDQVFYNRSPDCIFHLHGHYEAPESIVLGLTSYSKVLGDSFNQSFTRMIAAQQGLIFIGYGAGFEDPNFSQLLKFVDQHGSLQRHYVLVQESDISKFSSYHNIYPVCYGKTHSDLAPFVRTLPFGKERYVYFNRKLQAEILNPFCKGRDIAHAPELVMLPSGTYDRPNGQTISIHKPFHISCTPITIGQWEVFTREVGAGFRKYIGNVTDSEFPAVGITYQDALEYVSWLNQITGFTYRLPTETEWEYAASGGARTRFWWGDISDVKFANYRDSQLHTTTRVKSYPPNKFGLHDMLGNTWEWCIDHYHKDEDRIPVDGTSFVTNLDLKDETFRERILKGGCFYYGDDFLSHFSRIHLEEDMVFNSVGFRVVREILEIVSGSEEYFITSLVGPYALQVNDAGELGIGNFDMSQNQKWRVTGTSNQLFQIFNTRSKAFLASSDNPSDYNSLDLISSLPTAGMKSDWDIKSEVGGYIIVLDGSSKAVDVEGGRSIQNSELILFERHSNFNQIWRFIPST